MRDVLSRLIEEFHERELPEPTPREAAMPQVPGKATAVVGMRRAGKTWFCYQHMRELLHKGIPKERLLYLNFEDDRLLPFSVRDFQAILDVYFSKFPDFKTERCFLFLDEAQRIEGWESFVRRVLDTENIAVYVTGSSSKLLSTEIATSLRGRSVTTEIFPFSFAEALKFHRVALETPPRFGAKTRAILQNRMAQYLRVGGFPEVQGLDDELRRQVSRNSLDVAVLRDVLERHRVASPLALRALLRQVMTSPATRLSVNKLYNSLRSQGIPCTKNRLYEYMDHLNDAFVVFRAPIHSRSERVRRVNPSKVYAIDTGLLEAMAFHLTEDRGALLENLIYLQLRRQGIPPEYYVTREGGEVDFAMLSGPKGERALLQVCWSLEDPDTREREASLLTAMKELKIRRGTIVTWMDEESTRDRIEVVPAWKWLVQSAIGAVR